MSYSFRKGEVMITTLFKLILRLFFFTGRIGTRAAFMKPLSHDEERECFQKIKLGDKLAEEKLIEHNLRLVAHIVKKYKNVGYEQDELISIGSIGLLKAIRSYDIDHGNNFSTYASRCISNEILMLLRSDKKRQGDVSLDAEIATDKDGNSVTVKEVLPACGESIEEKTETKMLASSIIGLMHECLTEREYEIMSMRYGLNGEVVKTQQEVADQLGISRSYISRIEKSCIEILRSHTKKLY